MTDNKLTDEQIIKAFEHLVKNASNHIPITGKMLLEDVLDVLNRQKEEKEALINGQETLQKHIAEIKAEVELYKRLYEDLKDEHCDLISRIKTTKSEARKEFAERLKEMSEHFELEKENFVSEEDIENLLKEMEGE